VQIVFAGKAHPADRQGQDFIRRIVELSLTPAFNGHLFFLEDYDARVARFLVQGTDLWVNNPRPPLEASGTSGMKAAINGTLNLSVLDGWWVEGYNGENGWTFGSPDSWDDHDAKDRDDAQSFYKVMETDVIPLFYERGADGVPTGWAEIMRNSMASTLVAYFPMGE
jgi:starch phosphorylase